MKPSTSSPSSSPVRTARTSWRESSARSRAMAAVELLPGVRANHAAAAGQPERLDHARKMRSRGSSGAIRRRQLEEPGDRQAGRRKPLRASILFTLAAAASGGLPRKTERLRDPRRQHDRPIANREHTVDRRVRAAAHDRRERRVLLVKTYRDRAVAPRIVEMMAAIVANIRSMPARAADSPNERSW